MLDLSQWDSRGYYRVGDRKHYSKIAAIEDNIKSSEELRWIFNDDIFSKHDWTVEPEKSLDDLYAVRAQQLRNDYDWLCLSFSGGSDSVNILQTFVKNNIQLDELLIYGPFSAPESTWTSKFEPGSYMGELEYVAIPFAKSIREYFPNIKITLYDWVDDMLTGFENEDWIYLTSNRFNPASAAKVKFHSMRRDQFEKFDKGLKVVNIYGVDKPRVYIKDESYYLTFLDLMAWNGSSAQIDQKSWEYDEWFYWSPDSIDIMCKQAHILKNFFDANPELRHLIKMETYDEDRSIHILKQLVYPGWNIKTIQAPKTSNFTMPANDKWLFTEHLKTPLPSVNLWLKGLSLVDEKLGDYKDIWLKKGSIHNGVQGTFSKFYKVGNIN
tara:strand:- start:2607 stop:3752 length:1146 start_codon:yes stop_codon:yes gene_type:complete